MELVLDLGNTNKKLALFNNGRLTVLEQHPTLTLQMMNGFLERHPTIHHAIFSSVVRHPNSMIQLLKRRMNLIELTETTPLPIKNRYRSPATLGKDRLAAAIGGAATFPNEDVLVITAGTCITYDFVNKKSGYMGGAISPGLTMRLKALHTFTGNLPLLSIGSAEVLTGRNTEESILSGVLNGTTAEIEGVVARYRKKHPALRVILSGGDQNYLVKRLKISIFAVPNIVIHGLYQILDFNAHLSR